MNFGGMQRVSTIDYPGKISTVIFLSGCNFRCPYCHNPDLAMGYGQEIDIDGLMTLVDINAGNTEAIVISGGEPTIQSELIELCKQLKGKGFPVKLDTNGSNPAMLKELIENDLLDYIAMDIKTSLGSYPTLAGKYFKTHLISDSIKLIMGSDIDYEFRTTCASPFVSTWTMDNIAKHIKDAKRYILQPAKSVETLAPKGTFWRTISDKDIEYFRYCLQNVCGEVTVRGW
jgi:pyruvate formate lyase activating enzyme